MIVSIEFRGIDISVEGEYTPKEVSVRYDSDMGGYPGSPESYEITRIWVENTDVTSMLEEHMEEIEKIVLEQFKEE